jgi:hypothetical protein
MKQELEPFEKISREIGISPGDAEYAISRFLQWLSSNIQNYDEGNRDFIGEELHWKLSRATFYHLLGLFDEFSDRYSWERGSAAQYLLRIAPREEWPSYDDPAPDRPDPKCVADTMRQFLLLADGYDFTINLATCDFDSRLYAHLLVEEKHFNEDLDFTMIDYVPLTTSELNGLVGMEADAMLRRIETISKGKDCITSTRGVFRWAGNVWYPHT